MNSTANEPQEETADLERSIQMTKDWDDGKGSCDCVTVANSYLSVTSPGFAVDSFIDQKTTEQFVVVAVHHTSGTRKKITEPLLANYCPFCGRKYQGAETRPLEGT